MTDVCIDVRIPHLIGRHDEHVDRLLWTCANHPDVVARVLDDWASADDLSPREREAKAARNVGECWSPRYYSGATHVLVLEDDAIVTPAGVEAIVEIAARWTSAPIGLFCCRSWTCMAAGLSGLVGGRVLPAAYVRVGASPDIQPPTFAGGVAMMMPVDLAAAFHGAGSAMDRHVPWDIRATRWVRARGIPVVFPAPSPVDHSQWESTLHPDRPMVRAAWYGDGMPREYWRSGWTLDIHGVIA